MLKLFNTKQTMICFLLLLISVVAVKSNEISLDSYQPRYIVDMPTAGTLDNLQYSVNAILVSNGGFLADVTIGIFKVINFSLSYGGTGIIGYQTMNMQKYPGFHIKGRILGEKENVPAIALGFNSQGKGTYDKGNDRYEQLAPDFYVAASKSFKWAVGSLALTGGINYSLLVSDDKGINVYAGIEQSILNICGLALEVNPNLNDKSETIWKEKNKTLMLNGAIKFTPLENMIIEIQFKDMLRNSSRATEVGRYFGVSFISKLF